MSSSSSAMWANCAPGSPEEIDRFQTLQKRLGGMFEKVVRDSRHPHTAVIVPSLSLQQGELAKVPGVSFYEERLLCMLMLLREPRMRIVLVTSQPIHPTIIDYYLHLLVGVPTSHARQRLTLLSTYDTSARPLTEKVLERPNLMVKIRKSIPDTNACHLVCFNTSTLERTLAVRLGIPLYSCDPELLPLGTKSGSRKVFREAGVNLPPGYEDLFKREDVADSLIKLWVQDPSLRRAVVKLNEGFSGEGNAIFEYNQSVRAALDDNTNHGDRIDRVLRALHDLKFESETETWPHFANTFEEMGGVVEAFIEGEVKRSPSVQCRVNPMMESQAVSTHDQILGGPSGQVFLGCEFPANLDYRMMIQREGRRVSDRLAAHGVIGRFGVDFIVVKDPNANHWTPYAIEINLRKGGTTHPFLMLKFLTDGSYDQSTGEFIAPSGAAKYYIASDNISAPRYRGVRPDDLVDIAVYHKVHFNSTNEQGVVFHLMGSMSQYGKTGVTCIGNTLEEAKVYHQRTIDALDFETPTDGTITTRLETL
jgi:hypothetical protein